MRTNGTMGQAKPAVTCSKTLFRNQASHRGIAERPKFKSLFLIFTLSEIVLNKRKSNLVLYAGKEKGTEKEEVKPAMPEMRIVPNLFQEVPSALQMQKPRL
jgi:hypothetical protein